MRALVPYLRVGRVIECDLEPVRPEQSLDWTITEALASRDRDRAVRAAADRLAFQPHADGPARDALRREWAIDEGPEIVALRDPRGALTSPRGADVLADLLGAFPADRKVALIMRGPLPPALQQVVDRDRQAGFGPRQLAFRPEDTAAAAQAVGLSDDHARAVHAICKGWPLATTMLLHGLRAESQDLLEAAAAVPERSLFAFGAHRLVAGLAPDVRNALAVATILGDVAHLQLVRILGDRCDDAVFARLCDLPFATIVGDRVSLHPEVRTIVRSRFEPLVSGMYERTLRVLTGEGRYVDAARIAIDAGDANRAASIVNAAPPYTAARAPIAAYGAILDHIDRTMITRFPNIWIATIPYRSFAVDSATYVREAETVNFCMPASASEDQRAAVLMILASAYVNFGRTEDADAIIEEGLHGFAGTRIPARAAILNFAASLRGIEGRFSAARALAAEAAEISADTFGETQVLLYIEAHEAAYRGKQDRVVVIADELLRRRKPEGLPLYVAHTALSAATFSWVNGDDEHFDRYLGALEDAVTPGLEAMFGPVIDAARGHAVRFRHDDPWPSFVALAELYRAVHSASDEERTAAARAAARAADQRGDPYLRLLAHAILFAGDERERDARARILNDVAASVESAELQAAIRGLIEGSSAGMLEPFLRRVRRSAVRRTTGPSLELLAGRVAKDGVEVRLTDKEFELLALLASTRGALTVARIGELLWDHLEPEEWRNNLKVTVYRIRKKLSDHDTIVSASGGYRLAPTVDVDLRRVEAQVRERSGSGNGDETRAELRSVVDAFSPTAAARYERYAWGQQLLARVGDTVCRAGIMFASDAFGRGADTDVLWAAERVREIDAFNEDACELTIRVLLRRKDVDGARREYERFAAALAAELDAKPSARLSALVRSAV